MKKYVVLISFVVTIALFYFNRPDRTELDESELFLPVCSMEAPLVTKVSYFVDSSIQESYTKSIAEQQIRQSNKILSNSCLPLSRELASFRYVDLALSGEEYFDEIHSQGSMAVGRDVIQPLRDSHLDFYVFVVPNRHLIFEDGTTGATDWELSDSYILLADDASTDVLEHEFGHLMWANHSETFLFSLLQGELERSTRPENRHLIKPYARAYKCSNAGTVMSYEKIKLPIYSSPTIKYRSEVCGNELNADNRKRVLEYIDTLRELVQYNKQFKSDS
ncbi:hypothetical protein KIT90_25955 [Vibrio sp. B172a]|uniref:hypothetical protein n=1 Tax=Vibrio sp. B172a TaxID=2835790 RepID=UPI002553EA82|nr:hypothetical protein [Vibrio sp. B172a]MDK9784832.1 hypothetical protein [Vibrio sp. B172a]